MKPKRHWLTTVFGILLAIGTGLTATNRIKENPNLQDVALLLNVVGAVGLGGAVPDARNIPNGENPTRRDTR